MVSTYEQYLELRRQAGYDDAIAMIEEVWNACEPEDQESMLAQLRRVANARKDHLENFGGDHW